MRGSRRFMNAKPSFALQICASTNRELIRSINIDLNPLARKLRAEIPIRDRIELRRYRILRIENDVIDSADSLLVFHQKSKFHQSRIDSRLRNRRHLHPVEVVHLSTARWHFLRREGKHPNLLNPIEVFAMKSEVTKQNGNTLGSPGEQNFRAVTNFMFRLKNSKFFQTTSPARSLINRLTVRTKSVEEKIVNRFFLLPLLTEKWLLSGRGS